MLKKRILASSLASVMALSSVSVVAFADETATADLGEVVSKAELKEYVKSFDDFVKKDLAEYGTVQSKQFNDALKYAKNIADTKSPADEEVIAAYQMLKNVRESMQIYTAEELAELVADLKDDYDSKNIMNAAFQDNIWETAEWPAFAKAYKEAAAYTGKDARAITDYYTKLVNARAELKEKDYVTKEEFRDVYTQYMNLAKSFKDYEGWRRGKCTVNAKTGEAKNAAGDKLDITKAKYVTFDELQTIVYGTSNVNFSTPVDRDVDAIDAGNYYIKYAVDVDGAGTLITGPAASVQKFVENAYTYFNSNKNSSKTTNTNIMDAYKSAKEAIAVFDGWKVDDADWGTSYDIEALITKYQAKFVKDNANGTNGFAKALAADTTTALATGIKPNDCLEWSNDDNTLIIKAAATPDQVAAAGNLIIDMNTGKLAVDWATNGKTYKHATVDNIRFVKLSEYAGVQLEKGMKLTEYLPVTADQVSVDSTGTLKIADALKAYEKYQQAEWLADATAQANAFKTAFGAELVTSGVKISDNMDTNNTIKEGTGSMDEYTLIYRYLKYAFEDKYPEPAANNTKDQIVELMDQAIVLIDETGDAAKFNAKNAILAKEYNAAAEWVAAANQLATYKDGTAITYTAKAGTAGITNNTSSNDVYTVLKTAYDNLAKEFAQFPYSYAEIVETVAAAAEGLEDEVYGIYADEIKGLVSKISVTLSTIKASKDCEVFDVKRNFIGYNRTNSKGSDAEKDLIADYEELLDTIEEASKEPEVVLGDLTGDGVVNAKDALMIVQYAVGEITLNDAQKAAADFNKDGNINALDAYDIVVAALD